jgi:hypothetical protein
MLSAEDSMWWKSGLETAVARHSVQGLAGCLATARLDILSASGRGWKVYVWLGSKNPSKMV